MVFRTRSPAEPEVGRLVEHSKRQVRGFVGCHKMLERDLYIVVCLAFNHWHTGMEDTSSYPEYVLAIHSSKRLLVEQISPPAFVLADAIISLTLAKGQRHEVSLVICTYIHQVLRNHHNRCTYRRYANNPHVFNHQKQIFSMGVVQLQQ